MNAITTAESLALSLVNPIDTLAVLDRQVKELTAKCKELKDQIANEMGEGSHRGEQYGVTVSLVSTTTVDYKALLAELGATAEQIAKHTTKGASIRVSPKA